MGRSSFRSEYVTRSGNGSIQIVVKESSEVLYLDPMPGGERVKQGCDLVVVGTNLTSIPRTVVVAFSSPLEARTAKQRTQTVTLPKIGKNETKSYAIHLRKNLLGRRSTGDVFVVKYRVKVDGTSVDPDLEIER